MQWSSAAMAVACLAAGGCAPAAPVPANAEPSSAQWVRLERTAHLPGIAVTPLAILEDSRCPVDVTCVWAGRLRIRARIEFSGGSQLTELELGRPVEVQPGRRLVLTGARPERSSEAPVESDAYLFSFAVE